MRSLFLNLEMMLRIDDRAFADAMRRYVEGEVEQSVRLTREAPRAKRTWFNRIRWGIAYFLVAIADYSISHRLNFGGEPTPSYSFQAQTTTAAGTLFTVQHLSMPSNAGYRYPRPSTENS